MAPFSRLDSAAERCGGRRCLLQRAHSKVKHAKITRQDGRGHLAWLSCVPRHSRVTPASLPCSRVTRVPVSLVFPCHSCHSRFCFGVCSRVTRVPVSLVLQPPRKKVQKFQMGVFESFLTILFVRAPVENAEDVEAIVSSSSQPQRRRPDSSSTGCVASVATRRLGSVGGGVGGGGIGVGGRGVDGRGVGGGVAARVGACRTFAVPDAGRSVFRTSRSISCLPISSAYDSLRLRVSLSRRRFSLLSARSSSHFDLNIFLYLSSLMYFLYDNILIFYVMNFLCPAIRSMLLSVPLC